MNALDDFYAERERQARREEADKRHRIQSRQTKHKPKYDYKCTECGIRVERDFNEATFVAQCDSVECEFETRLFKKVFSKPFIKPMLHSHFNQSVGREISDMGQYKEVLKRQTDYANETTGIEHNFQPLEYGDHQAFGATGEGIYESNVIRSRKGEDLLPEIPGEV